MVLSAILLLLIILSVAPALLFSIPAVQNATIDKAAVFASEYLGTKVEVGKITIGAFNRVVVRDFYVEDLDGDTLLYVKRADAYIAPLSTLAKKNLVIFDGEVKGGKFVLRETERKTYNVKEITDKLVRKDRKSQFRLDISDLRGSDIEFRLHRLAPPRSKGVDFANMQLLGIDVELDNFVVNGGAVRSDIASLSFAERTGFELKSMTGRFSVDVGKVAVDDAVLTTERSKINLDHLLLDGNNWLEYKDFINNVPIRCQVSQCDVSSEDVGYFAPAMWRWKTSIRNATASMDGTVADFKGVLTRAELERGGVLRGSVQIKGLIDVENTLFDIKVDELRASTNEITYLLNNIARLSVKGAAAEYVSRVAGVNAKGAFKGTIHDFKANLNSTLSSGGAVALECAMKNPTRGRKSVKAKVSADNVDLAKLLANNIFGDATFDANVDVEFGGKKGLHLTGTGGVKSVGFNGYAFENINLLADIENDRVVGEVEAADKALAMNAKAVVDWSDRSALLYDAVVDVERADLYAMNVNRRDSVSVLSGRVGLSAQGNTIDEMNGVIQIADAKYQTIGRGCDADMIRLAIESTEDARTLSLSSDFADAVFESRTPYKDVIYYLKNLLVQYAPMMYDDAARRNIGTRVKKMGNELAILSVTTKDIDPLLDCVTAGLEMAEGSKLDMLISPSDNRFTMRVSSEYLMHHNYLATNINVHAGNQGDSLAMTMAAQDFYVGMFHFSDVDLKGGAKDSKINVDAIFADSVQNLKGQLSAKAQITRKNNRRNIAIKFNPSSFSSGDTSWKITTDGIEIDSARIDIRRFAIRSNTQELLVDGVASHNERDSVHMVMRNFSLAPLTQITNRVGYIINGSTNGYATVHSALKNTRIDARIEMDSVDVNGIGVPDLLLVSKWDFGKSRASLDISTLKNNRRVIQGYFAPSQMRYYARMKTGGVNLSLLDPLLSGVITDTKGWADVDVSILGEGRMAELKGEIDVDSLATTIAYTQCRYMAPKAKVMVRNNRFIATDVPVMDQGKGKGVMSLDVSLAHLSNIEYNLDLKVNNMKVLNTTDRDNSMFYGSVFASGTGTVRGDKAGVKMDFVARSEDNSKFYMPLTDNSDIQSADFVKFATKKSDTTSYLMRKKMMFENRRKRRISSGSAMDITMALDVRPNAEAQLVIDPTVGDIIKGTGEGLLNMRFNPQADIFEMYGDYTIEKGSYLFTLQNVINKWFDIEPGSTIQWTGDPLNAILNIDAVYRLKASLQPLLEGSLTESNRSSRAVPVECFIHLTDRLMQPTVTFDIVVPNADSDVQNIIASALATPESKSQQFLYLIIANSFISESTNSMSSSIGASATAATGFEMLSNQFSNWLSSDDYKIVLRYRPRTERMSDEVDFGFSKGLINNRLLIEVEGNYIVDKAQVVNATSNFTGEAYLTWLIDRAGTLRLKGFTHTIDRFDENQGLQETGLGIYFKEDFNNAKDLRMRLKNRFKREKKDEGEADSLKVQRVVKKRESKRDKRAKEEAAQPDSALQGNGQSADEKSKGEAKQQTK